MTMIDAFPHIIPRACLERFLSLAQGPALDFLYGLRGRAYLAPMWDLDARFRSMDAVEGYVQVLTLCLPPIEQIASGRAALDLARFANDSMAELVVQHPDATLDELRDWLRKTKRVKVSISTVWRWLAALALTRKKSLGGPAKRIQ